jgi:P4 family phage/plasmid primase-like protien
MATLFGFDAAKWHASQGVPVFPFKNGPDAILPVPGTRSEKLKDGVVVVEPEVLLEEFKKYYGQEPDGWAGLYDGWNVALDIEREDIAQRLASWYYDARKEKGSKGAHFFFRLTDKPVKGRGQAKEKDGTLAVEVLVNWACVLAGSKHRSKKDAKGNPLIYTLENDGKYIHSTNAQLEALLADLGNEFDLTWQSAKERQDAPEWKQVAAKLPLTLRTRIENGVDADRNNARFLLGRDILGVGLNKKEFEICLLTFNSKCKEPDAVGKVVAHAKQIYNDAERGKIDISDTLNDDALRSNLNKLAELTNPETGKHVEVSPGLIVKAIAPCLAERDTFITLDDTGVLYRFKPEDGVYCSGAENWVRGRVQELLSGTKLETKASRFLAEEVVASIKRSTFRQRDKLVPQQRYTPLANGIYDFEEKKLLPFGPEFFFTTKLAVAYDPTATCPAIDKFLGEVCPQQTEALYELGGYICKRDNPMQKAWVIDGNGNNGKSKFIGLLTAQVGKENSCAVPLQKLEGNRFSVAELEDKYINAVADLSAADMKTTGLFKAITGGDMVMAERKGQHPFRFYPFGKLVYSCNAIPDAVADDSNAYYRRWILLSFNVDFTGKEDRNILAKITTPGELSGFLNKGLAAMEAALARGAFTGELNVAKTRELYIAKANSAKAFLDLAITRDPEASTAKPEVWKAYNAFCKERRLVPKTETAFGTLLKCEFQEARVSGIRSWQGLTLPKSDTKMPLPKQDGGQKKLEEDGENDG